ncbi:hypothetical protein KAM479_27090 [Aeromonas caviae]|uniref:hypothetical protein n=1 Tax=Aeromonas caviae TaxID=648 RepID=UPI001FC81040|nr:hypothetical protein [Aeromonas caviae]BDN92082.1 hypothetical protein KAM497c_16260 [Aeromonas caviae]GJB04211.1 hypothetical protein KAM360_31540 [Aeromonas caviae]GKR70788.1 hypothetical protein KAM479_27090 [Aeromonas caviae]
MTSKTKTDWTFHRANYAVNYPGLSVAGYARQFDLNPNTAKAGLRGALTDPANELINLSEYDPRTGERLADKTKTKGKKTDRTVDLSMDRITPDTPLRSATDEAPKNKNKAKSNRYNDEIQGDEGTAESHPEKKVKILKANRSKVDRSGEKRRVVEKFTLPALGESWANYNAGGYTSMFNIPPEIQMMALAPSSGIGDLLALAKSRYFLMWKQQGDMVAKIEALYSEGGTHYMGDGEPMPKEMALSQALFGPSQRMTELESVITRMEVQAASEQAKTQQVVFQKAAFALRKEEALSAIETANLIEANGFEVPKALLLEVKREVALIEQVYDDNEGGITEEELEAEARAYQAKREYQREIWLPARVAQIEKMLADEAMKQSEMQISEEDFIAQMVTLDAHRSSGDID